jgi:ABC-type antimicrobial peptide transport system permease subunit
VLVVRASGSALAPAIRHAVSSSGAGLAVSAGTTLDDQIGASPSVYLHRSLALVMGGLSGMAFLLSIVGLCGVIAYSVSQRTREIGVRMALGAERVAVTSLVLWEAGWLTVLGIGAGLASAIAAARLMRTLFFGVRSSDPATHLLVSLVMAAAALLAGYIPARAGQRRSILLRR